MWLAFCRWLESRNDDLESVTTNTVLDFMRHCRETSIEGRPANVLSMTGKRLDHYSATTINHRLAALTGLFTFRTLREPDPRNPMPSGREARSVSAEERSGLLGHLVRPKRRSVLRLREPRRLPRSLDRRETADLLQSADVPQGTADAAPMAMTTERCGSRLHLDLATPGPAELGQDRVAERHRSARCLFPRIPRLWSIVPDSAVREGLPRTHTTLLH